MSGDEQKLNPQIRNVEIGVRNLRKITIYPMSLYDQTKFLGLIEGVMNSYFENTEGEELNQDKLMPFLLAIKKVIGSNIQEIMGIVLDEAELTPQAFFGDVTNLQMSKIVTFIFEDNFEESSKNVLSLVNRFKELFQLERLSPLSLKDTLNSDLTTFIEEVSEKED